MESSSQLTLLEKTKVQAEVLVPLIRKMEEELGTEVTHRLVRDAIGGQIREQVRMTADQDRPSETVEWVFDASRAGDAQDHEWLENDRSEVNVNVTRCEFARFYQQLGAPDLGFLLVCMLDYDVADGLDGVGLTRSQTIMQGGDHCDFRWKFEERG